MRATPMAIALISFLLCVMADNCTPGLFYCGSSLLREGEIGQPPSHTFISYLPIPTANTTSFSIGNYQAQIDQALYDARQNLDNSRNALFYCIGGANGLIRF